MPTYLEDDEFKLSDTAEGIWNSLEANVAELESSVEPNSKTFTSQSQYGKDQLAMQLKA